MARRSREDNPGALHHVYNRGIARRTVFVGREDVQYFLSRLARVHRKGRPVSRVSFEVRTHRELLLADSVYACLAGEVLARMLDRMHGEAVARLRAARPGGLG